VADETPCAGKGDERGTREKVDEVSFALEMVCHQLEHCVTLVTFGN